MINIVLIVFSELYVGDLRIDVKKITDKFFAPGSRTANFLDSFVRGEHALPVTTSYSWSTESMATRLRKAICEPS